MNEIREVQATDVSAIVVDGGHAHVSVVGSERLTITMHRAVHKPLGRQIDAAFAKADDEEHPQIGGG